MIKAKYSAAITDKPWWLAGGIPRDACVAAYQPIGASDYAASKINLTGNAAYNAVDGAAYPTWAAATGWHFNTNGQYLSTNIVPFGNQSWSAIVRFNATATAQKGYLIDGRTSSTTNRFCIVTDFNNATHYYQSGTGSVAVAGAITGSNVMAFAGTACYLNGISDGIIPTGTGDLSIVIIGAGRHLLGTISYFYIGYINSIAIYNATLTANQVVSLTNAMNAL